MKISKRTVDALPVRSDRYIEWDDAIPGFGVRVLPTGMKSYLFVYRTAERVQRKLTLGRHGEITAEQARKRAEQHRAGVRTGADPMGAKKALREAVTVSDVLDAYLASDAFTDKADITRSIDRGRIERHLRPLLGGKHAHLLTRQEVIKAQASIAEGKTAVDVKTGPRGRARVRGGAGAARMAITLLKIILNWAVSEEIIKANPAASIRVGPNGKRETILDGADAYGRLFATLDRMEAERRIRQPVADAMRLIALTGCRRGEAANLKWSYVDLREGKIVIPARAHKTGKKTGEDRVVSMPAAAQVIVARQEPGEPDDYVFRPARSTGGSLNLTKAWRSVRAEAKLPANIGLHGLRHSLASHMAMAGAGAPEIMQQLGHRNLSTSQRYIHFAETARQALAEKAAATALAGMAKAQGKPGKVVRLKKA